MVESGLRPLSLGEILDRTFSLYRRNFILFVGITGLPHLLILALNLGQVLLIKAPVALTKPPLTTQLQARGNGGLLAFGIIGLLVGIVVYLVAYLFSQGGTIYAVSELYLGRTT